MYWLIRASSEGLLHRDAEARRSLVRAYSVGADTGLVDGRFGELDLLQGDLENAEKHLLSALDRDPDLTASFYNLGILRLKQRRVDEAVAVIHRGWDLGERNSEQIRTDPDLEELRRRHLLDDLGQSPPSQDRCEF